MILFLVPPSIDQKMAGYGFLKPSARYHTALLPSLEISAVVPALPPLPIKALNPEPLFRSLPWPLSRLSRSLQADPREDAVKAGVMVAATRLIQSFELSLGIRGGQFSEHLRRALLGTGRVAIFVVDLDNVGCEKAPEIPWTLNPTYQTIDRPRSMSHRDPNPKS